MDLTTQILEWLEDQLETATEQGGNEIIPGVHVEEAEPISEQELVVKLSDGRRVNILISERQF